jgi:hypothetical protein
MRISSTGIAHLLIFYRMPLFAAAVALAVLAFVPASRIEFDRSVENMFAPDDPLLVPYRKLKRTFGGNEVVVAVYRDEQLLDPDGRGIRRLAEIRRELEALPGVYAALSLDQPLGLEEIVKPDDRVAGNVRKLFEGYTHSADGRTAAIVCMLAAESDPRTPPRRETIDRMRAIVGGLPGGMIAGEPVMVTDGFQYIEEDGRRLGWASTVLLGLVIVLSFRSVRWVIVPVVVVQLALLLTRAALVASGLRLSMVSSMLTAIVTVVGIATVVHVIVRFREARLEGLAPREALERTMGLLAAPVFWACATTAVGFASLLVAQVGPVRDFGLMMAVGALMVLGSVVLVLPTLALAGRIDAGPRRPESERFLDAGLDGVVRAVRRWPKTIGLASLILAVVAAAGVYRLEVETDFTQNFRAASPIVRSYEFIETNLGGAGVWDILLPAGEHLDWNYLTRVRRLESRLRREVAAVDTGGNRVHGLTKVLSLDDAVLAGSPKNLSRVPGSVRNVLVNQGIERIESRMPALVEALHGQDPLSAGNHYFRIMLRARERQPAAAKRGIIRQVESIVAEEFPASDRSGGGEVTGFFVLLTNLIDSMLRDQWLAFGVATAGIGLMMLVAVKSPLLAAVTLVPNVMPIIVVTGLMGWAGVKINMGAAMIAAVSMGLSIDSSIHYTIAFQRARREAKGVDEALALVQQSVGRAMVFSTLALIVGFAVLATSQFVPTIYFGVLVSLTMLGGLAGNLVLLPLLLKLVSRRHGDRAA